MRWPWRRKHTGDRLVVAWSDGGLAFVRARLGADGLWDIRQMGLERQGTDDTKTFVERLAAVGLKGLQTHVMLRPEQCQFLQVDAPNVTPEEMRSAARYQIREMIETHIDDITLDVLRVGDGQQKNAGHIFVVVATNAVLRSVMDLAQSLQWDVPVIDIQEMAQRNLQSAIAARDGTQGRASAALVLGERLAMLTISANGELFYTRRLDLPDGFLEMDLSSVAEVAQPVDAYTPVSEYVPDYAAARVPASSAGSTGSNDVERAQRFLVEVQRSLDLWERTWSSLPLAGLSVQAGARSATLAQWLTRELGQTVLPMDVTLSFPALSKARPEVQTACLPLLGVLLRTEGASA
jgi:MSHA biogenesis protein MshI